MISFVMHHNIVSIIKRYIDLVVIRSLMKILMSCDNAGCRMNIIKRYNDIVV